MVIVFAGRRAQSLPDGSEGVIEERLRRLVKAIQPTALIGSAADGADQMVLEASLKEANQIPIHLVLPTEEELFQEDSVDPSWRQRYNAIREAAEATGGSMESLGLPAEEGSYRTANRRMIERATEIAGPGERVVVLVIAAAGEGEIVEDLVRRGELAGAALLRIDPSVDIGSRPECFVAMPFGTKYDPQRRLNLNCDLLYERILVPALENAQLRFRRADEQIDSGVVLQPMIEAISEADIVIGDLATGNFNVGWELGLRHLLRPSRTVLMAPKGTSPPFDLSAIRHVPYEHAEEGISDEAAIAAWQALAPYLEDQLGNEGGNDSPVDAVMDVTQWARIEPRQARDEAWEELRERLALARDLGDENLMLEIVDEASGLGGEQRELVAAEAGVGLVRLGSYRSGREQLAPLVRDDLEVKRPEAHVFYAQTLYRDHQATIESLDKAEQVLKRVLVRRPGHPEIWALIGAINKRRALKRDDRGPASQDLRRAMDAYGRDFYRDLNAFYEGINFVACGLVLGLEFGDEDAASKAAEMLPTARLAAELASERDPSNFWAAASVAETKLQGHLLELGTSAAEAIVSYRRAGNLQPPRGWVRSSIDQLRWLQALGLTQPSIPQAAEALAQAAGIPGEGALR